MKCFSIVEQQISVSYKFYDHEPKFELLSISRLVYRFCVQKHSVCATKQMNKKESMQVLKTFFLCLRMIVCAMLRLKLAHINNIFK